MGYFYSKKTGGFYHNSMRHDYTQWPDNAVQITDEEHRKLLSGQSKGKIITYDNHGYPVLSDPPAPSQENLIEKARKMKNQLMAEVNSIILPLQDAMDLDIATDGEREQLLTWKKYRVLLNRVNISTTPNINWPTKPNI